MLERPKIDVNDGGLESRAPDYVKRRLLPDQIEHRVLLEPLPVAPEVSALGECIGDLLERHPGAAHRPSRTLGRFLTLFLALRASPLRRWTWTMACRALLRKYILTMYGTEALQMLGDFGMKSPKNLGPRTAAAKAEAQAKATRAAKKNALSTAATNGAATSTTPAHS